MKLLTATALILFMIGGEASPFRPPAGSGREYVSQGTCGCSVFQHAPHGDEKAPVYAYAVKVPNPLGGDPIAPYERYFTGSTSGCTTYICDAAAAPCSAWLGTANNNAGDTLDYQYSLVSGQPNTLAQVWSSSPTGTINFAHCHKSGKKTVAAKKQWDGCYPWNVHSGGDCDDTLCLTEIADASGHAPGSPGYIPTYSYSGFDSQKTSAPQTKYLTLTVSASYSGTSTAYGHTYTSEALASGSISVDAHSGETTNSVVTSQTDTAQDISSPGLPVVTTKNVSAGAGTVQVDDDGHVGMVTYASGQTTVLDGIVGANLHCTGVISIGQNAVATVTGTVDGIINFWNDSIRTQIAAGVTGLDASWLFSEITSPNSYSSTIAPSGSGMSYSVEWSRTDTVYRWSVSYSDASSSYTWMGSLILSNPNTAAAVYADAVALANYWPLNDDHLYPWRTDDLPQVAPLVTRNHVPQDSVSPLNGFLPATVNDMRLPISDSNGNPAFSLASRTGQNGTAITDGTYPPNAAGWTPTYDGTPVDWVPTYTQMPWFDPAVYEWRYPTGQSSATAAATALVQMVDGSVLGAPIPLQGTYPNIGYGQDCFDFNYQDWHGCCYSDPETETNSFDFYQYGWGMKVSDYNAQVGAQLPLTATQWTNNIDSLNKPPGASLTYNDNYFSQNAACQRHDTSPSAVLWLYKTAEIIEPWQSQNLARPYGADKFAYDEDVTGKIFCVANLSGSGAGSTWTLTDWENNTPPDGLDVSGIWGGASVGGFYGGCSYHSGVLTLGSKVYDVPSAWASRSGDDGTCIGRLRFPTTTPGMTFGDATSEVGGRQAITVTGSTSVAPSLAQPWLSITTPETVCFYSATMALIATTTLTRISDSSFTAGADVTGAVWMTPKFFWDGTTPWNYAVADQKTKGDFLTLEWLLDNRTNGENTRLNGQLDCSGNQVARPAANNGYATFVQTARSLPLVPFAPKVLCYSPNGETFPNGITVPMPTTFVLDEQYGSRWQSFVQATMTDIFWQPPHRPCGLDLSVQWAMDDGTCPDDTDSINYFARPPQVEALTVKVGAGPALPSGISIGWLSPVTNTTGDVAFPVLNCGYDAGSGYPLKFPSATGFYLNYVCATSGCRFDYTGQALC